MKRLGTSGVDYKGKHWKNIKCSFNLRLTGIVIIKNKLGSQKKRKNKKMKKYVFYEKFTVILYLGAMRRSSDNALIKSLLILYLANILFIIQLKTRGKGFLEQTGLQVECHTKST